MEIPSTGFPTKPGAYRYVPVRTRGKRNSLRWVAVPVRT